MDTKVRILLEWQALQHAPLPYWRTERRRLGDIFTEREIEWMAEYQRWFFGQRLEAMRGLGADPMQRIVELERENQKLREALEKKAYDEFLAFTSSIPMAPDDINIPGV